MFLKIILFTAFSLLSLSKENHPLNFTASNDIAQGIVDQAINAHGGNLYAESKISFDFRGRKYSALKNKNGFEFTRSFTDSTGHYKDILNNQGFSRKKDGEAQKLSSKKSRSYSNSVNSVIYFAYLPYGLNDPAAKKKYLGETEIEGEPYQLIQVTFNKEGGGDDFEDVFLYWFHKENHTLGYLAYLFHVDKGGLRFRKAINSRVINGIRFVDYINYKANHHKYEISDLEDLYKENKLKELSRIELVNVVVSRL